MRPATILCVAFMFANGLSFVGADLWYSSTRPKNPDPLIGRIYSHHFKGSATVYLTASETTGLSLLPLGFLLGLGSIAIAYSKEPRDPMSSTGKMKEPILTRKHYIMLWCAIACYIAMVVFVGPFITDFAVSHGVILDFDKYGA
jgi:hypothetical protein